MEFRSTRSDGQLLYIEQEASRGKVSLFLLFLCCCFCCCCWCCCCCCCCCCFCCCCCCCCCCRAGGKQREGEFLSFILIVILMITLHQVGAGGRDFLSLSVLQVFFKYFLQDFLHVVTFANAMKMQQC